MLVGELPATDDYIAECDQRLIWDTLTATFGGPSSLLKLKLYSLRETGIGTGYIKLKGSDKHISKVDIIKSGGRTSGILIDNIRGDRQVAPFTVLLLLIR